MYMCKDCSRGFETEQGLAQHRSQTHCDGLKERFWDKVDIRGENECWLWKGSISEGYGRIRVSGEKVMRAHRAYYTEIKGEQLLDEEHVYHKCGRGECVNPKHLGIKRTGTRVEERYWSNVGLLELRKRVERWLRHVRRDDVPEEIVKEMKHTMYELPQEIPQEENA